MKTDYSRVHAVKGKESAKVKVSDLDIGGMTLGELIEEHQKYKEAYWKMVEAMKNKVVLSQDDELIVALDDKIMRGKISAVKLDEGEKIALMKVEDGKIVKDKKKVGKVL